MCNLLYTIPFGIFYISEYFLRGLGTIDSLQQQINLISY
jgi:hypothetical protein